MPDFGAPMITCCRASSSERRSAKGAGGLGPRLQVRDDFRVDGGHVPGLANVGGRILKPGQSIEGLTLVKVYEDRAVFLYRGDRLTVYVKPPPGESDDER